MSEALRFWCKSPAVGIATIAPRREIKIVYGTNKAYSVTQSWICLMRRRLLKNDLTNHSLT